jgi:hypothetical protein
MVHLCTDHILPYLKKLSSFELTDKITNSHISFSFYLLSFQTSVGELWVDLWCENSGELTFYTKNLYSLNVEFKGKTHRKYLYGFLCFDMILQLQIFQQKRR